MSRKPDSRVGPERIRCDMRVRPSQHKPVEVPDFIEVPERLQFQAKSWPEYFTDLPHEVCINGKLNLKKMPTRGSDSYGRYLGVSQWLKSEAPTWDKPNIAEHMEAIRSAVLYAGPHPRRVRNMERYVDWLYKDSGREFRERLQKIEGLSEADVKFLDKGYRELLPSIEKRVEDLAWHFIATENHTPRMGDIEFVR